MWSRVDGSRIEWSRGVEWCEGEGVEWSGVE